MSVSGSRALAHGLVNCILFTCAWAFLPHAVRTTQNQPRSNAVTSLFGVRKWRHQTLTNHLDALQLQSYEKVTTATAVIHPEFQEDIIFPIPILVLDSSQVALPGETVFLQLTKDSEVQLFQRALNAHAGVFALGFASRKEDEEEEIVYDKVALVEIKDYNNMIEDEFGIFARVQVVGRAVILHADLGDPQDDDQRQEPMMALCSEIRNRQELTSLEEASQMGRAVEDLIAAVCIAENESRVLLGDDQDRSDRYHEAYQEALGSDSEGYICSSVDNALSTAGYSHFSWKELNALSWAAFCTGPCLAADETFRLAALDNDCLTNRLKLATFWLSDLLADAEQVI